MSSAQPAATTQPTNTFDIRLGEVVNLAELLKRYGLDDFTVEENYDFRAGLATITLHAPIKKDETVSFQTMLDRGGKIGGGGFGLTSFIAMMEQQASIPDECRGVIIVCETVLVASNGPRFLAYAYWRSVGQRWVVSIGSVDVGGWDGSIRLVRRSK